MSQGDRWMQGSARKLLQEAGVEATNDGNDSIRALEQWLGMHNTSDGTTAALYYEGLTAEDVPLSRSVLDAFRDMMVTAWQDEGTMRGSNRLINTMNDDNVDPDNITLIMAYPSIRVTQWLRHALELRWVIHDNGAELALDSVMLELLVPPNQAVPFCKASLHHVSSLSNLQAEIHAFVKRLQQPSSQQPSSRLTTTTTVTDPQKRLEQYERATRIAARLQAEWQTHLGRIQTILDQSYRHGNAAVRTTIRKGLGRFWQHFVLSSQFASSNVSHESTDAAGISLTLQVLRNILRGSSIVSHASSPSLPNDSIIQLVQQALLPLHQPDSMVLWRDQTPLLELYHQPLTECLCDILQMAPAWGATTIVPALCDAKTITSATASSGKQVLILHGLETYLSVLHTYAPSSPSLWDEVAPTLTNHLAPVLARTMASYHSRVAERALQFVRNAGFQRLVAARYEEWTRLLLPVLVASEPSWNPTVRKMTAAFVTGLRNINDDRFAAVCDELFASKVMGLTTAASGTTDTSPSSKTTARTPRGDSKAKAPSSLHSSMPPPASMRPPPTARPAPTMAQRPGGALPKFQKGQAPPLTITGVAPWAMPNPTRPQRSSAPSFVSSQIDEDDAMEESSVTSGLGYVLKYIEQLRPKDEVEGISSWSKAQMAETPTLLPHLKFHDLVFGQQLGVGAFGAVKYARLIDKTKTRSHWPEYAVKIVSTEKIAEMGYEASIRREMAILRVMSHPGIARLISSFRFREGVYLVLEYASQGDLYDLLAAQKVLDVPSTRFVIGEVLAALASIHDLGFVYADLKPENCVITEAGHVKLTDFGACRAVSNEARTLIRSMQLERLSDLRDGNWKPPEGGKKETLGESTTTTETTSGTAMGIDQLDDDHRVEGTTAYLPPEVVHGGIPTPCADAWALGSVMFQCLVGFPPMLQQDDEQTRQRIVSFAGNNANSQDLFDGHADIDTDAQDFVRALLPTTPSARLNMTTAARHAFFKDTDVFALHRGPAHVLETKATTAATGGAVGVDPAWQRRQFSSIWAPQPQAYHVDPSSSSLAVKSGHLPSESEPIMEGDERNAPFVSPNLAATQKSRLPPTSMASSTIQDD